MAVLMMKDEGAGKGRRWEEEEIRIGGKGPGQKERICCHNAVSRGVEGRRSCQEGTRGPSCQEGTGARGEGELSKVCASDTRMPLATPAALSSSSPKPPPGPGRQLPWNIIGAASSKSNDRPCMWRQTVPAAKDCACSRQPPGPHCHLPRPPHQSCHASYIDPAVDGGSGTGWRQDFLLTVKVDVLCLPSGASR